MVCGLAEEETRRVARPPKYVAATLAGVLLSSPFANRVGFSLEAPGTRTARRPSAGGTARGNQPRYLFNRRVLSSRQ